MHRGKLIKVMIGLAEPMREGYTIKYLFMSQGVKKSQRGLKEFRGGFKVIPTRMVIFRMKGPRGS
jgi:hypothetical protein